MLKRTLLIAMLVAFCPVLFSFVSKKPDQKVIRTIIIDAGHGGHDVGARGSFSYEKDICLDVALKLGAQLQKELPDAKIIYTRTSDSYPELHARADLANRSNADLFISIHVNSAPAIKNREFIGNKKVATYVGKGKSKKKVYKTVPQYRYYTTPNPAKGTETYIWGAHKNEDKEVAIRENAPMMTETNYKQNYGDIDPNSPEFIALSLLKTKQYFKRSATLAGLVEDQFRKVGRTSREVRQRQVGIWVLQATAMPSILVETGFISHKEDEKYLNSEAGQLEIADCITTAVKSYVTWIEKQQNATTGTQNQATPAKQTTNKDSKAFLDFIEQKEKKVSAK